MACLQPSAESAPAASSAPPVTPSVPVNTPPVIASSAADSAQTTPQEMDARPISAVNLPQKRLSLRVSSSAAPSSSAGAVALSKTLSRKNDTVPSVAKNSPKKKLPNLRNILKSSPHEWTMAKITRFGHCLFESVVLAFRKLRRPELPQTYQELRSRCAKQLLDWNGIIPGNYMGQLVFSNGVANVEITRGKEKVDVTLQQYCDLIETNLYGGYDEIMIIVNMFKVQIIVYHDASYTGGDPEPVQIHMVDSEKPATHEINSGNYIHSKRCTLLTIDHLFQVQSIKRFTCSWRLCIVLGLVITRRSWFTSMRCMLS
jgi:hypothetical protein